jgi:RNA polymerase primary sigma factor
MIAGLCESPLTFQAIIIWREELNEGNILLRDIIDLEATYAGPEAKQAPSGADARGRIEQAKGARGKGTRLRAPRRHDDDITNVGGEGQPEEETTRRTRSTCLAVRHGGRAAPSVHGNLDTIADLPSCASCRTSMSKTSCRNDRALSPSQQKR